MSRYRQYVLPTAIVLGLLLHNLCGRLAWLVPWLIFTILLLTFAAVDLRQLRLTKFDTCLMLYQIVSSAMVYLGIRLMGGHPIIAEGVMMGFLCPVAASVTVVSCMLGARRETVTGYSIFGNLMAAIIAPIFFTLIGHHPEQSLGRAYLLMLGKIGTTLAVPFFVALLLQLLLPRVNGIIARRTNWSYYVWAFAFLLTIGQTIDYIVRHGEGHWHYIVILGTASLVVCALQFFVGRRLGRRFGDPISGAQLMGQKNSAMGIWMANTFLSPLSSVFMAFYSIFQNLYNAYQIAHHKNSTT